MSRTSSRHTTSTTSSASKPAAPRRSPSRLIRGTDAFTVAAIGDSITEGSPGFDARKGGDETSQWEYWAALQDSRLRFRNCGRYGERTDEIAARFDDCIRDADVVIVQGGINDIAQGRDLDSAAQYLRAMVQRGKELQLRVAICDVLPWNNGWPGAEPEIRALNARIVDIAQEEHIVLLPFHDTLEDPERPGRMKDEWTHADGDHPSVAGYRRLGEVAFRVPD